MSGNVYEWVEDRYHDNYSGIPQDGGAWEGNTRDLRSAGRNNLPPDFRNNLIGFRLARTLP